MTQSQHPEADLIAFVFELEDLERLQNIVEREVKRTYALAEKEGISAEAIDRERARLKEPLHFESRRPAGAAPASESDAHRPTIPDDDGIAFESLQPPRAPVRSLVFPMDSRYWAVSYWNCFGEEEEGSDHCGTFTLELRHPYEHKAISNLLWPHSVCGNRLVLTVVGPPEDEHG